jgi:neutral amino acid transport system ATP-binding protein
MTALLTVEHVDKSFGGIRAVQDCSLDVLDGSITGLIGPNGSGKTTMFNIITGYLRADSGTVVFRGTVVRRPDPCRLQRLGLARTFQQARIFPTLSVLENVVLARQQPWSRLLRSRVPATDQRRAQLLLDEFNLDLHANQPAGRLSYGQRKLLEFATVLMGEPRLVLLDEPTAGVNPVMADTMAGHVRARQADGVTFLVVEHEMRFVMRLCDRIIVLDRGTTIACADPVTIQNDPRVLDAYLGA